MTEIRTPIIEKRNMNAADEPPLYKWFIKTKVERPNGEVKIINEGTIDSIKQSRDRFLEQFNYCEEMIQAYNEAVQLDENRS